VTSKDRQNLHHGELDYFVTSSRDVSDLLRIDGLSHQLFCGGRAANHPRAGSGSDRRGVRHVIRMPVPDQDHVHSLYEQSRTHLSLNKDAPVHRAIAAPGDGRVVAIPQVGGLHHRYERQAA